jgi:lysophospholipase L1-like esterase
MKSTSMKKKVTFLSGLFVACLLNVWAQDTITMFQPSASYSFINNDVNFISNPELLAPFYAKLADLKKTPDVVSILHIGDSHIQADRLTGMTRTLLQQEFGNAGLGLIFPGRTARTNESPFIISSSTGQWESDRISYSQNAQSIGIGGNSIKTESAGSTIKIKTLKKDHSFNRMILFFQKNSGSYNITVKDSARQLLAYAGYFTDEAENISKLNLPYSINQFQLETVQSLPSQNQFTLFGVSLENSSPGIRYHIIGANGAKYKHYAASKELLHQSTALNPDLIIISLGTNEASDHPNLDKRFGSHADTLITELRNLNPDAIILLTTPVDFYKKNTHRNPGTKIIKNKIIETARKNKLPWWNLHEVAGSHQAADKWKKEELMQSDGIHFTKKGYELQGHLLFEAIIKGYNEYVLNRHSKTP